MMTIGQLAQHAGVGVETIRFYERKGLIVQPQRPQSGYRRYGKDTAQRIQFIRAAKNLGFTLNEIKEILELASSEISTCGDAKEKLSIKIEFIDSKIKKLLKIKSFLHEIHKNCENENNKIKDCPLIQELQRKI